MKKMSKTKLLFTIWVILPNNKIMQMVQPQKKTYPQELKNHKLQFKINSLKSNNQNNKKKLLDSLKINKPTSPNAK